MSEPEPIRAPKPGAKSKLPDGGLPGHGASRHELLSWLSFALGLAADPIADVQRYGRHLDARLVLTLRSKERIVFERQSFIAVPLVLRDTVSFATGFEVPLLTQADIGLFVPRMVRAAELADDADDRHETRDWCRSFLAEAEAARNRIDVAGFSTPAERWEALRSLLTPVDNQPSYAPAAMRSRIVAVHATGDVLLRVGDFGDHVRERAGSSVRWGAIHGRVIEVGWQHPGEVAQRQPGGHGHTKARIYTAPAGWDDDDTGEGSP